MYVEHCVQASELLDEVIARLHFHRFPLPIRVRQVRRPSDRTQDTSWQAQVLVTLDVRDREDGLLRIIKVYMTAHMPWDRLTVDELRLAYLRRVYTAVRQCVLHELAECAVFEDRLFDDPHTGPTPGLLRPERDVRFPPEHDAANPLPYSEFGF